METLLSTLSRPFLTTRGPVSTEKWQTLNIQEKNSKSVKNIKFFSLAIQAAEFMILQNVRNYITTLPPPSPLIWIDDSGHSIKISYP